MTLSDRFYDRLFWALAGTTLAIAFLPSCEALRSAVQAISTPSPELGGATPGEAAVEGFWGLLISGAKDPAAWGKVIGAVTIILGAGWAGNKGVKAYKSRKPPNA